MMPRIWFFCRKALFYLVISAVALVVILPFLWMISTSFKRAEAIMVLPIKWIPAQPSIQSYVDIFTQLPFFRAIANSLFVSILTTAVVIASSSMAAFAFAKFEFKHKEKLFMVFIATMMIPQAVVMIPNYLTLRSFRLIGSFTGLILPMLYNIWAVFLLRQNIMTIPEAYFEAAIVDGASTFTIFSRIVVPMSRTILATLTVITFMGTWNDFLWPLVILTGNPSKMTLPLALNNLNSRWGTRWEMLMAGNLVSLLPIVLIYLAAQKYFESGISVGSLKG